MAVVIFPVQEEVMKPGCVLSVKPKGDSVMISILHPTKKKSKDSWEPLVLDSKELHCTLDEAIEIGRGMLESFKRKNRGKDLEIELVQVKNRAGRGRIPA